MARHENVLMLLGSCSEGNNRLLVYEYVCNGSLNGHLSVRSNQLTWERTMKIAMGTAKGLDYLHRNNIYGTVRPSNILLTHDYEPIARPLVREKMYGKLIDPAVLETHNLHQLVWMVRVVERCISFTPENRCSIEQVTLGWFKKLHLAECQ